MNWEVIIPRSDDSQMSSSITVEAENWFTALRTGLDKQGMDKELISNINCVVKEDQSVEVTDFVTKLVFTLRPLDGNKPPGEAKEETRGSKGKKKNSKIAFAKPIPAPAQSAKSSRDPKPEKSTAKNEKKKVDLPPGLPEHQLFYSRDEAPEDGGGIFYRERLVAVPESMCKNEAALLARAYFEQLKAMGSDQGTKLFISIQVFDHSFSTQAERPAVAALTWRQWRPKKPRILFPLSGDEGVTFSKMPPVPERRMESAAQAQAPVEEKPVEKPAPKAESKDSPTPEKAQTESAKGPSEKTTPPAKKKKAEKAKENQPAIEPPKRSAEPAKDPREAKASGIDDKMFEAFERMQELFSYREHDTAAQFVLDLAREMVDCEAGSCLLVTPGLPQLYVAAAHGPFEGEVLKKTISIKRGIIGFATRSSAVVTVRDPESDPRFDPELDFRKGFHIRNLICAPIQHEGRTHGVIELLDSPRTEGFDQHDANILSYLGGSFGEYIENVLPSREDTEENEGATGSSHQAQSTRPSARGSGPKEKQNPGAASKSKSRKKKR